MNEGTVSTSPVVDAPPGPVAFQPDVGPRRGEEQGQTEGVLFSGLLRTGDRHAARKRKEMEKSLF